MGKLSCGLVIGIGCAFWGCGGGGVFTTKVVDTPQGTTTALGAPHSQMYSFEAEPELD